MAELESENSEVPDARFQVKELTVMNQTSKQQEINLKPNPISIIDQQEEEYKPNQEQ